MNKINDFEQIDRYNPEGRLLFAAIFYLLKSSRDQDVDKVLKDLNDFADTFLEADGTPYLVVYDGEIKGP